MTKTISMKWLNASILIGLLIIAGSYTRPAATTAPRQPAAPPTKKRGQYSFLIMKMYSALQWN